MKNIKLSLLMGLLFLFSSAKITADPDPNFYIFLCFGQSNMEGQAAIESQDKMTNERFQVMSPITCSGSVSRTAFTWSIATPPLCRCNTYLCPVDYFGRTLLDSLPENIKIGVINVAVAGCDIQLFEKNNYSSYVSSAASWMQSILSQYGNNPYQKLIDAAKEAQNDGVIKGILMHQGETNSGQSAWPNRVKGVYENILSDLGLSSENVPLLVGEVLDPGQCSGHNSIIETIPNYISNSYVISSDGCTGASDNLHFNAAGYRLLGKRYAEQMLKLLDRGPIIITPDYYYNGSDLVIQTEEMPNVGGDYCQEWDDNFFGMAYYANNDLTSTKVNFQKGCSLYLSLTGCADATTKASVTVYLGSESTTFEWNSSETSTITKAIAVPDSGTYTLKIVMETDQGQSDAFVDYITLSESGTTDMQDQQSDAFLLYPNPTNGMLYVNSNNIKELEILDLLGISQKRNAGKSYINTDGLEFGNYLLKVKTNSSDIKLIPFSKK